MITTPEPPIVAGTLLRTSGAVQVAVIDCPNCGAVHRHLSTGLRTSPCGQPYVIRLPDDAETAPQPARLTAAA